jgi:carbonic anhydrase
MSPPTTGAVKILVSLLASYALLFVPLTCTSEWEICHMGTQQSPVALLTTYNLASNASVAWSYPSSVSGTLTNWGYGPSWAIDPSQNTSASLSFETAAKGPETVYLAGWHTHTPSEHTVDGVRSRAELHFVHATAEGKPRAVVGFRIRTGNSNEGSKFVEQLPEMLGFNSTEKVENVALDLNLAIEEVGGLQEFWTYDGSLTSPPCTEGKRWFVARQELVVSDEQMMALLKVSTYSARPVNDIWRHGVDVV